MGATVRKVEHESVPELGQMDGQLFERLHRAVRVNAVGGNVDAIETIIDRRAKRFAFNAPGRAPPVRGTD